MSYYVPGTEETDPKKIIMSLQQTAGNTATNTTNIATNTANIATNTANIATNTANIATNTSNIATNTSNIATNTADIAAINAAWTAVTPVLTAQSGSITSGSATGRYKKNGKTVIFTFDVQITTAGTATQAMIVALPFTAASNNYVGSCYEYVTAGNSGAATVNPSVNTNTGVFLRQYNGATFFVNGAKVAGTIVYETP